MAWVKLDDQIADHPKIIRAGPLAAWLFITGLTYCARHTTDGLIPFGQVRRLADVDDPQALAQALVRVGLWNRVDDGYQVHDYLDYQPSAQRVREEREAANARMGRYRERYAGSDAVTNGVGHAGSSTVSDSVGDGVRSPSPYPVPYPVNNPDPDPVPVPVPSRAPARAREDTDPARLCSACRKRLPARRPKHGLCADCHGKALMNARRANIDANHISLVELTALALQ